MGEVKSNRVQMALDEARVDDRVRIDRRVDKLLVFHPGDLLLDVGDIEPRLRIGIEGRPDNFLAQPFGRIVRVDILSDDAASACVVGTRNDLARRILVAKAFT